MFRIGLKTRALTDRCPEWRRKGFTLLELIIVITLMTIVLGVSGLHFVSFLTSVNLEGVSRDLRTVIRMAHIEAMIKGETQMVIIDLDGRRFGMAGAKLRTVPEGISISVVDLVRGEQTKGTHTINAHPSGSVQPGTIIVWNAKRAIRIEIDPVVGSTLANSGQKG